MLTDTPPIYHNHHHDPDDASTAASSPSATSLAVVDDSARNDTEGVSPEVPPTVADVDQHDSPANVKGADAIMLDSTAEIDHGGLEPNPELATEPTDDDELDFSTAPIETQGEILAETLRPREVDDGMDIDNGIAVEEVRDASPHEASHAPEAVPETLQVDVVEPEARQFTPSAQSLAPSEPQVQADESQPGAPSPAHSNNTMPSTLDQMRLSPKIASRSPSRSHSPVVVPPENAMAIDPPVASSSSNSLSRPHPEDDAGTGEDERPAKRQRSAYEDPSASPSSSRAAPAAAEASPIVAPAPNLAFSSTATITPSQLKFSMSTIRQLKRSKDSLPFLAPVDVFALNIPHYPNVVKCPMDIGTIERKLNATKKGGDVGVYRTADEFVADVRLIWENSYAFNGRQHAVSLMAERLQETFEKQIKHMPPLEEVKPFVAPPLRPAPIVTNPVVVPIPAAAPSLVAKKSSAVRRPSTSIPAARRSDHSPVDSSLNVNTRPKREIHAPPPKDFAYAEPTGSSSHKMSSNSKANGFGNGKKAREREHRDDGTADQLKFCQKIVASLFGKQYGAWAFYFWDPVDASFVPNYYKVIKKPMDLSTIRQKLEHGEYPDASKFYSDFQQIIKNCFLFNPEGSVVREAGAKLQQTFDEKWAALPPLKSFDSDEDESGDESDDSSDVEREKVIRSLEDQVSNLNRSIESLKASQRDKKKRRERAREERQAAKYAKASSSHHHHQYNSHHDPPYGSKAPAKKGRTSSVSSASKANGNAGPSPSSSKHHQHKSASGKANGVSKKAKHEAAGAGGGADEDGYDELDSALDNVQKKELSEAIEKLEGSKLEKVITIIQEGVPGIGNNSEEIELEIDALPSIVLQRLYNFVVRPLKSTSKPSNPYKVPKRTGSGNTGRTGAAATGGVKRKSMDEIAEAEKIRSLEEKARILSGGAPSAAGASQGMGAGADEDDSVQSSDESGSDSESESD